MRYFAYGSNMSLARIRARAPSAQVVTIARLSHHTLKFHKKSWKDGSAKCDIAYTGSERDEVFGVVFDIDQEEKAVLDKVEGLHNGYEIKIVNLTTHDGRDVKAFAYYATDLDASLKPFVWYKEHVLRGAKENKLPPEYLRQIEAVCSVTDPDPERHNREMALYGGGGEESIPETECRRTCRELYNKKIRE